MWHSILLTHLSVIEHVHWHWRLWHWIEMAYLLDRRNHYDLCSSIHVSIDVIHNFLKKLVVVHEA